MPKVKQGVTDTFIHRARKEAKRRGIGFSVTKEYLERLFEAQGERCVYTGREMVALGDGKFTYSLDRMDSDVGYEEGNLQFVWTPINSMKHVMKDDYFLFAVRSIVQNQPVPVNTSDNIFGPSHRRGNFRGHGPVSGERLGKIRHRAELKGIEFDITAKDLANLFVRQQGLCAYTSWPLKFVQGRSPGNASVDRLNSSKGYTKDNILIVHKDINFMKNSHTEDEFFRIITEVYNWSVLLGQPNKIIYGKESVYFV